MMKKWMPFVCALALLAGCAGTPQETPAPAASPSPPSVRVQTDWSKLEPKAEGHVPLYTRRYENWTDRLIPADDYGKLYPFAGEKVPARHRYMGEEDEGVPTDIYKYGLVTERGEVVVDPVYDLVGPPCDRYLDGPSFYHPMPDLLLLGVLVEREPDPDVDYDGPVAWVWRYGAAARDGSWVTELVYTDYYAADDHTLLLTRENGETEVWDASGAVRFTIPAESEGGWSPQMCGWSDGMVVNTSYQGEYYYYDAQTGRRLLGPYLSAQPFYEGLAAVQDGRSGLWGYIDKAGAWAIEPMFEQAGNFSQGMALVRVIGSLPALVGRDGRFALEANQGEQIIPCGGDSYGYDVGGREGLWYLHCTAEDGNGMVTVLGAYGGDGAPLAQPAVGERVTTWWGSAVSRMQGNETLFYQNGVAYSLPLAGVVREAAGQYVILQKALSEQAYQYALMSLDGTVLAGYGECESLSFYVPPETGRTELRAGFRDGTGDYRDETYELEPSEEGLTYVLEDWGCGYRNADGVWVFCWPWLLLGDVE